MFAAAPVLARSMESMSSEAGNSSASTRCSCTSWALRLNGDRHQLQVSSHSSDITALQSHVGRGRLSHTTLLITQKVLRAVGGGLVVAAFVSTGGSLPC